MSPLPCTSRHFLQRAEGHLHSGDISRYLYAAVDLRFGIEARLSEYLQGAKKVFPVKEWPWQIKIIKREIEKRVNAYESAVQVLVCNSQGKEALVEYTPVTGELEKVGARLGEYLHYSPDFRNKPASIVRGLESLITSGVEGLKFATRGTLVTPPLGGRLNECRLIFERGYLPFNLQPGDDVKVTLKAILTSKDEFHATFKPA